MSGEKAAEIVTPRTATAGSLLSQWWTLGDIILDRRTNGSGRHTKVAWVIIDRHMQAKGNSRASVRFIEQATGLSKGIILKACRELVEWGYMTQRIGIGTRPTEYSPNWSSVSPASNAKSNLSSVPLESNTTDSSVPPVSNESYLPEPADKAELQVGGNIDTHGAPPTAGPKRWNGKLSIAAVCSARSIGCTVKAFTSSAISKKLSALPLSVVALSQLMLFGS